MPAPSRQTETESRIELEPRCSFAADRTKRALRLLTPAGRGRGCCPPGGRFEEGGHTTLQGNRARAWVERPEPTIRWDVEAALQLFCRPQTLPRRFGWRIVSISYPSG